MLHRLITLAVWALLGWTLLFLLLRLLPAPLQQPAQAVAPGAPAPASLSRLFGSAPLALDAGLPPPPASTRFQLLGVVAPRGPAQRGEAGVALLAIDGGPPRSYRVGDWVDGELRLLSVESHGVGLGQGQQVQMQLSLPPLAAAATGTLPGAAPVLAPVVTPPPPPPMPTAQDREPPEDGGPRRPPPDAMR